MIQCRYPSVQALSGQRCKAKVAVLAAAVVVDVVVVELRSPGQEGSTLVECGSWQVTAGQK
jgi:hypothetical protein